MHSSGLVQDRQDEQYALHLPTELLIAIVDQIEADEDLLTLAATSRQFHVLSLNRYFRRHEFDPYSKEIEIHSYDRTHMVLAGLSIFLDLIETSIERLSYDCGYSQDGAQITKEVHLLTKYVSMLSSVAKASLHLAVYGSGVAKERRDMSIIFLDTVLAKRCSNVRITTSQLSSFHEESKNMPPYSKPADWLKNYWPTHHSPPEKQYLTRCSIQTFPRFLRPFYFHTLGNNSSSITDLSFKNVFGGGADWATMLTHLHFPHLRRFAIIYGVIPRDPFIKFLGKHPGTLTAFEYHHIRYEPQPKYPMRTGALEAAFQNSLESLTTSPEHITNFFPTLVSMSRLSDVEIEIEEFMSDFSPLESSLIYLASCVNKITLTLVIIRTGLGFGAWFTRISTFGGGFTTLTRPERRLRCVETLVIDNGDWGFTDDVIVRCLPQWVGLFPELRTLTLRGKRVRPPYKRLSPFVTGNASQVPGDIVAALKEACPGLYVEYSLKDS